MFEDNTKKAYDEIALDWYNRRHWSIHREVLEEKSKEWRSGKLLNIGCAHGPEFIYFKHLTLTGLDSSEKMLENAETFAKKHDFAVELKKGVAEDLPFNKNEFNYAIAMAVYNHVPPKELSKAFKEAFQVLKPNGTLLLSVINPLNKKFLSIKGLTSKKIQLPWKKGESVVYRDYWLYYEGELKKLLIDAGFEKVKILRKGFLSKFTNKNYYLEARK